MSEKISIRFVGESDVPAFRELRLEALREHPESFGSDYQENLQHPESFWIDRVREAIDKPDNCIVLADAGNELAAMLGVFRAGGIKNRHAGTVWGVYVRTKYRGKKLGDQMLKHELAWCRENEIRILRLTATTTNAAAIRCYSRCGFEVYGVSPQVIRIGEKFYDELLMWRAV